MIETLDLTDRKTLMQTLPHGGRVVEVGLETCDLPQHFDSTRIIQQWEDQFWKKRIEVRWWKADIDTTFALYRRGAEWPGLRPAVRADRPYTARHVPWYRIESEEEQYYEQHADPKWATWSNWEKPIATQPARRHVVENLK